MSDLIAPEHSVAAPHAVAVVQLYDTAIKHIGTAIAGANKGDFDAQMQGVLAANQIFSGLDACLDMEKGGAVAANLREMYQALVRALLSTIGQPSGAEVCAKLLDGVRDTRNAWADIAGRPQV